MGASSAPCGKPAPPGDDHHRLRPLRQRSGPAQVPEKRAHRGGPSPGGVPRGRDPGAGDLLPVQGRLGSGFLREPGIRPRPRPEARRRGCAVPGAGGYLLGVFPRLRLGGAAAAFPGGGGGPLVLRQRPALPRPGAVRGGAGGLPGGAAGRPPADGLPLHHLRPGRGGRQRPSGENGGAVPVPAGPERAGAARHRPGARGARGGRPGIPGPRDWGRRKSDMRPPTGERRSPGRLFAGEAWNPPVPLPFPGAGGGAGARRRAASSPPCARWGRCSGRSWCARAPER